MSDDYYDKVNQMLPSVAQDSRLIVWVLQDRWAKAEAAASDKGKRLVVVRCGVPACRSALAFVHETPAGPLFDSVIKSTKLDQLDRHPGPWDTDRRLRGVPEEVLGDDAALVAYQRRVDTNTPHTPYDALDPPGDDGQVLDLLSPPPSPDGSVRVPLWVRCKDHPVRARRGMTNSELGRLQREHPVGATAVDRQTLIWLAAEAVRTRRVQECRVPAEP